MIDVTTFLLRWMFLSNLLQNVAEIQTFPQQQYVPYHGAQLAPPPLPHQQQNPHEAIRQEEHWRNQCLQNILSYPPGGQRLLMVDAYRVELVHLLDDMLNAVQNFIKRSRSSLSDWKEQRRIWMFDGSKLNNPQRAAFFRGDLNVNVIPTVQQTPSVGEIEEYRDNLQPEESVHANPTTANYDYAGTQPAESHVSSGTHSGDSSLRDITTHTARERLKQVRNFLPQLVAAALKSPAPVNPNMVDPLLAFQQLLLKQCSQDPSWGIELCWLLEADVGRAWKAFLEHRQQSGRRLVVILPAEKAAVLAKIGHEKSAAFNLLQDAEQATAYGSMKNGPVQAHGGEWAGSNLHDEGKLASEQHISSRLSQQRCAHFGDTMHFIDRLTKLSLDLRRIPPVERQSRLQEGLKEMNRRIRRRMVTRGELTLDVDDNYGPEDWPQITELKEDMLQHSVHLPLVPQTGTWPNAQEGYTSSSEHLDVVRVLNIVVQESRLLSSRERCPFLVHLEVADTGMEGHDERLYSSSSFGSTVQEVASMKDVASTVEEQQHAEQPGDESVPANTQVEYRLPQELFPTLATQPQRASSRAYVGYDFPRGGSSDHSHPYQDMDLNDQPRSQFDSKNHHNQEQYSHRDESFAYEHMAYGFSDPSRVVVEADRFHQQLHVQQQQQQQQPIGTQQYTSLENTNHPPKPVLTGKALLDEVFGAPWAEKCREIKKSSPFGQTDGWRLASFIMKAGEDIRREALVMQIISKMRIWFENEIPSAYRPTMRPYSIMCVGGDAGLVECLSNAKSVDEVKKKTENFESLRDFFIRAYGPPGSMAAPGRQSDQLTFEQAQDNFLRSLVGYSLVCYVLQIKDRHNANILLDRQGHIMHIDFGFVLGDTPKMGKVPIFSERAPFKLSAEFWDVLGGWNTREGGLGVKFCKMFEKAFCCLSSHAEEIAVLVEMTLLGLDQDPRLARVMANGVRSRLRMRGPSGSQQQKLFIVELVSAARASWGTSTYDWLQKNMNGYQ